MSKKILCSKCKKNPATMHPIYGPVHCEKCRGKTKESKVPGIMTRRAPAKDDPRYHKEGWFKRNQKEWDKDIKSRKILPDGSVGRFDEKGKRYG